MIGFDFQVGIGALIEPDIKTAQVAGGDDIPYHSVVIDRFQKPFRIPDIQPLPMTDGRLLKPGLSAPVCLSAPATIFGTAPDDPNPPSQTLGAISADCFLDFSPVSNLDPLNTGLGDCHNPKYYGWILSMSDVTHHDFLRFLRFGFFENLRIAVEDDSRSRKPGPDVQMQAAAGGTVVVSAPQALEYPLPGQLFSQKAGQTAVRTERRSAGIAGSGTSLVVVAVADHAHPIEGQSDR